jgi:uncharacterized protein YbaP (TraB family)
MYKNLKYLLLFSFLYCNTFGQIKDKYQGLLWEISGNGLEKPSYLYGTMHVSSRVAFHLSEDFFKAVESADVIALETNPGNWMRQFHESVLYKDYYTMGYRYNYSAFPLYQSFIPTPPKQIELGYYIGHDQDLLNRFLYRLNSENQDFSEETFLDLFIYQAAKKQGKKVVALEDYEESFKSVMKSGKYDKDAEHISERQAKDILGDYDSWYELQEDAYRKGNLDLLDTMTSALNQGKYYRKNMLDDRNRVMADGMDSIMQTQVLFTGVGAAHLPGKNGVINMLRKMGYTVEAKPRTITAQSIEQKERIDELTFTHNSEVFSTEDGFIQVSAPEALTKMVSFPFQEYVYPDMANGSFYSIRRVNTFGKLYGLSPEDYRLKVDSLLFENIPGKIDAKILIELGGYPAYDIRNTTKKGDQQRYTIVFTPLEVVIVKVGGPKAFVETRQAQAFFESLKIGEKQNKSALYEPSSGGYTVKLPTKTRIEYQEGVFVNPNATFWAQAVDESGNYYAVGERKQYDFEYIEEDAFELRYLVERIAKEEKLSIDTLFLVTAEDDTLPQYAQFILKNKRDQSLYGQTHLNGNQYVYLLTTAKPTLNKAFFESFHFSDFRYPTPFKTYTDSSLFVRIELPSDPNNYESYINNIYNSRYRNNDKSYESAESFKKYDYEATGESLLLGFEKFNKYRSYKNIDALWDNFEPISDPESYILHKDSVHYTKNEGPDYLQSVKEYIYTDTASSRLIHVKAIVENGAIYSLRAQYGLAHKPSMLIQKAFSSFAPSGDTLFGLSPLSSRADLLFSDLESGDSTLMYGANNSLTMVDYSPKDASKIVALYESLRHKEFEREDRLNLLNRLAFTKNEDYYNYLKKEYYKNLDSSAYQFTILETFADFRTREANEYFTELVLDETPFTSNNYRYSSLLREFNDSLEIVGSLFPDLLELTDFEEYKSSVYSLLEDLVDSSYVKPKAYKNKRNTILRYAKVEYKKQRASEETESKSGSNYTLSKYNRLLKPYAKRKEVKAHYRNLLNIKNERVLAQQLPIMYGSIEIPDTTWNHLAEHDGARADIYSFLEEKKKLALLNEEYKTQEALAASMVHGLNYRGFDSISYLDADQSPTKFGLMDVYFFKVQNEDDKLWQFAYVCVPSNRKKNLADATISSLGERFNPDYDDLEAIKTDALQEIKVFGRPRVVEEDEGYY